MSKSSHSTLDSNNYSTVKFALRNGKEGITTAGRYYATSVTMLLQHLEEISEATIWTRNEEVTCIEINCNAHFSSL